MTDNKVLSWNITWKQWAGIAALFVFCFVIIYTDSLVVGYVIATAALSTFFIVVAFDLGLPKQRRLEEPGQPSAEPEQPVERKTA